MASGTPWYFRKKPPIYCECWRLFYECCYPGRIAVVIIASILLGIGLIILLSALVACIVGHCYGGVVALWPTGLSLLWFGLLFLHCGWAAHLLDDDRPTLRDPERDVDVLRAEAQQTLREPEYEQEVKYDSAGHPLFWRFAEKEAWQLTSNRDQLN